MKRILILLRIPLQPRSRHAQACLPNKSGLESESDNENEALRSTIMACVDQNSNAVLQGIARHINCLGEENRNTRKKALESIKKDTLERKPPLAAPELQLVFSEVAKPLLKIFFDPVEKCRELSINIIREYMKNVEKPDESLPYVIPVLVQRLGQQEITEPSEEIRLMLIEFLSEILEFSGKKLSVYLDDLMRILQRTISDPFPDVKKESCRCTSKIAKAIPEYFHMQSESLIKPLSLTITHQHAKVRTLVVETIGKKNPHQYSLFFICGLVICYTANYLTCHIEASVSLSVVMK